jgi:hypothetical protein
MTKNLTHFLQIKANKWTKKLAKLKTKATKTHRLKKKYEQLAEDTAIARKERSKRKGTYQSGQNLDDRDEEQPSKRRKASSDRKNLVCKSCGMVGHATHRARACLNYGTAGDVTAVPPMAPTTTTEQLTEDDVAEDLQNYTILPLQEEPGEQPDNAGGDGIDTHRVI